MSHRPSLLDTLDAAWPRIARMGIDAIARAHAAGHPAWIQDRAGVTWRLDPDGTRHVETRPGSEVLAAARAGRAPGD